MSLGRGWSQFICCRGWGASFWYGRGFFSWRSRGRLQSRRTQQVFASMLITSQALGIRLWRLSWSQSFSFHFWNLTVLSLSRSTLTLIIQNLILLFSVVSMKKHISYLLQVRNSLREVQVRFLPSVQTANWRRTRQILHVTGVRRRDTTGTSARKNWRWRRQRTRRRRRAKQQQLSQSLQTLEIWSGDSGGIVICGHACTWGGMLEIGDGYKLGITTE